MSKVTVLSQLRLALFMRKDRQWLSLYGPNSVRTCGVLRWCEVELATVGGVLFLLLNSIYAVLALFAGASHISITKRRIATYLAESKIPNLQ